MCTVLHLNSIEEQRHGPSYWKFNASLSDDPKYVSLINDNILVWRREFVEVNDKRVLWDLIKYRIRQVTIKFSKDKAKARRDKLRIIENSLKECEVDCGKSPSPDNIEKLVFLKHEYDSCYEYLSKGAIIRSRATWYEYGEKSNKYFLNPETHRKSKSCIRKAYTKDGFVTSQPKKIMKELESFYSDLYKRDELKTSDTVLNSCLRSKGIPKLFDQDTLVCEGRLTLRECFESLQSFQKNKSPGNDGLTVEFYTAFWEDLGELLVDSLNYSY